MGEMTIEQRRERARNQLDRLRQVTKQGSKFADRLDWRPKAKIYLHPASDLLDRKKVWFPTIMEDKDDDKTAGRGKKKGGRKVVQMPYVVTDDPETCPFAKLREILAEREDIDGDEIIFSVGEGRDKIELCKGEILNWKGYDFKRSLKPQQDFLCAAIKVEDARGKRVVKPKVEVLSAAKSLGDHIRKEIESEIDESGEDAGNPFITPYPFILTYDDSASPGAMYDARARITEKPDKELEKVLNGDAPDLESEITPADVDKVLAVINDALVRDDIEIHVEGEVFRKPDRKAEVKAERKVEPRKVRDVVEDDPPVEDQSDDDPADDEDPFASDPDDAPEEVEPADDDPDPEPDPEPEPEPTKRGRPVKAEPQKKAEPKKAGKRNDPAANVKVVWEPTARQIKDEEYDICPKCRNKIPQDVDACPHDGCGAKFTFGEI